MNQSPLTHVQPMMRSLLALVSLLPLTFGTPTPASAQNGSREMTETRRVEVAERLARSTVLVQVGSSGGSGFVVSEEGWIVTNAHVVAAARNGVVAIRYSDGTQVRARVLAVDRLHDLAVLQPGDREGSVPALPLASASEVRVGQSVLAYGSPFGLEGTLTQGIVSARRDLPTREGRIEGVIQTDAAVNPGNSGGPLANSRGQVIGVNTAILSRTGGSNGIGFAVPSNFVQSLVEQVRVRMNAVARNPTPPIRETRQEQPQPRAEAAPERAVDTAGLGPVWLGILGEDVRVGRLRGVRIQAVIPGGPASEAGLRGLRDPVPTAARRLGESWTGHIILAVDDEPVQSLDALTEALQSRAPGQAARLTLTMGAGRVRGTAEVTLAAPPNNP